MGYLTRWRSRRKAPIVTENYQAPDPDETNQAAQPETTISSPPAVHATWFNVHDRSDFRNISISLPASIDKITIAIGNHVRDAAYSIVSMSASAYSITVVCSTEKSRAEVAELVQRMKEELGQNAIIPPEELVLLREWEEKWGVVGELSTVEELGQNAIIPPEELVLLREWEEKWGVVGELSTVEDGLDTDVEHDRRVLSTSQSSTPL